MNEVSLTREKALYGLVFVFALMLRFVVLGNAPLGEGEATLAMHALEQSRGMVTSLAPQPGYVQLTTVLFYLLGAGPLLARFWPALMGSLLVWVPFLLRKPVGRVPALLLAVFLAFDPGMMALSRQADGLMLALGGVLLAIGFWLARRPVWGGVFLGLGLLGGPQVWPGLIALGVAWAWARPQNVEGLDFDLALLRRLALWAGGTVLVIGSLLLLSPGGLSAFGQSLVSYFAGWGGVKMVDLPWPNWQEARPAGQLLMALLVYHPWVLGMGLVAGLSWARRKSLERFLLVWWGLALLLALLYPSRLVTDLAWCLLPLLILAARQVVRWLPIDREGRFPALLLGGLTFVLAVFAWLQFLFYLNTMVDIIRAAEAPLHLAALATALGMIVVVTLLVGVGWNVRSARLGLLGGLGMALLLYSFAAAMGTGGVIVNRPELWRQSPVFADGDLLSKTLVQTSQWTTRDNYAVDGVVAGVPSEALRWALRDFRNVRFERVAPPPDAQNAPTVILTLDQETLGTGVEYTGQAFTVASYTPWDLMLTQEYGFWLTLRYAPLQDVMAVVWVRTDRFPGNIP